MLDEKELNRLRNEVLIALVKAFPIYQSDNDPNYIKRAEDYLFNESRLYEALGKEDARSVLALWEQQKEIKIFIKLAAILVDPPNDQYSYRERWDQLKWSVDSIVSSAIDRKIEEKMKSLRGVAKMREELRLSKNA